MATKPLFVRCVDRTVFEIDRRSLDPKSCSRYDAFCYSDPRQDVEYIEHSEWCLQKAAAYNSIDARN